MQYWWLHKSFVLTDVLPLKPLLKTGLCVVQSEKRIWPPQQILYSGVPNTKAVHLHDDGYVKSKFD